MQAIIKIEFNDGHGEDEVLIVNYTPDKLDAVVEALRDLHHADNVAVLWREKEILRVTASDILEEYNELCKEIANPTHEHERRLK